MAVKLNSNKKVVDTIKEGLKKTGGYCERVVLKKQMILNVCAKNLKNRLKILILKDIVIVCFITKRLIKGGKKMNETNLNLSNFEEEITNTDKLVLIDFFATWCGPCKMLSPIISEIANEYSNHVKVCKVNVDENQDLARKYNIMSIPTLIFLKDGKMVKSSVGFCQKSELDGIIKELL